MEQKTFRLRENMIEHVEGKADESDVSESEVIRDLIDMGMKYDELQTENERLRNQLQATNDRNQVNDKLVRYVNHDIDWHEAGLATKLRWFVLGKDR